MHWTYLIVLEPIGVSRIGRRIFEKIYDLMTRVKIWTPRTFLTGFRLSGSSERNVARRSSTSKRVCNVLGLKLCDFCTRMATLADKRANSSITDKYRSAISILTYNAELGRSEGGGSQMERSIVFSISKE